MREINERLDYHNGDLIVNVIMEDFPHAVRALERAGVKKWIWESSAVMQRDKGLNTGSPVHGFPVGKSQPSWSFLFLRSIMQTKLP